MTMVGDAYAGPIVEELGRRSYDPRRCSPSAPGAGNQPEEPAGPARAPAEHHGDQRVRICRRPATWASAQPCAAATPDTFTFREGGMVLAEDYSWFLQPGEAEVGWSARTGRIPLGYFNDRDATIKTFPEVDGIRVVISGDRAALEPDGTLRLFGRDSWWSTPAARRCSSRRSRRCCAVTGCGPTPWWSAGQFALGPGGGGRRRAASRCPCRVRCAARLVRRAHGESSRCPRVLIVDKVRAPRQRQGRLPVGQGDQPPRNSRPRSEMTQRVIDCLVNVHFGGRPKCSRSS